MLLNKNVKVPMPEHGAVKRKVGDKIYVYCATAVYRNEKGQPTCDHLLSDAFPSLIIPLYSIPSPKYNNKVVK